MHSRTSDLAGSFGPPGPPATVAPLAPLRSTARDGLKIAIVGGFGVGKTTLVGAVSEIKPLNTEETMSRAGMAVDALPSPSGKTRTTVAFDFGRITLDDEMVLYLFGAPGQERFWYLWERLFSGTMGAVVLVDTRRIEDSWYAIDRLESVGVPFVVARNNFGPPQHSLPELRDALALPAEVPLVDCDARKRHSAKRVLLTLVDHLIGLAEGAAGGSAGSPEEPAPAPVAEAGAGPGAEAAYGLRPAPEPAAGAGPAYEPAPEHGAGPDTVPAAAASSPSSPSSPPSSPSPSPSPSSPSPSSSSSSYDLAPAFGARPVEGEEGEEGDGAAPGDAAGAESPEAGPDFGAGPVPGPGGGAW